MKTRKEKMKEICVVSAKSLLYIFKNINNSIMVVVGAVYLIFLLILISLYYPFYYLLWNGSLKFSELRDYIIEKSYIDQLFDKITFDFD